MSSGLFKNATYKGFIYKSYIYIYIYIYIPNSFALLSVLSTFMYQFR